MNDHQQVRTLLALSAAGLLDAAGERSVRLHTAGCAECSAELESFAQLGRALGAMPAASPPPDLLLRTQALMAAEADRREGARLAVAAAVLTAILLFSLAAMLPVSAWLAWTTIPSILGGGATLALARHRRMEGSLS